MNYMKELFCFDVVTLYFVFWVLILFLLMLLYHPTNNLRHIHDRKWSQAHTDTHRHTQTKRRKADDILRFLQIYQIKLNLGNRRHCSLREIR